MGMGMGMGYDGRVARCGMSGREGTRMAGEVAGEVAGEDVRMSAACT